jgi:hypothetical protein
MAPPCVPPCRSPPRLGLLSFRQRPSEAPRLHSEPLVAAASHHAGHLPSDLVPKRHPSPRTAAPSSPLPHPTAARVRRLSSRVDAAEPGTTKTAMAEHGVSFSSRRERQCSTRGGARDGGGRAFYGDGCNRDEKQGRARAARSGPVGEVARKPPRQRSVHVVARLARRDGCLAGRAALKLGGRGVLGGS